MTNKNIVELVNRAGCFDLQFRKDTRHNRPHSPTYYRWRAQFVITAPKENVKKLEEIRKVLNCGKVSVSKDQARFSVQDIDEISKIIAPFLKENKLSHNKNGDFALWQKAVNIIAKNKGKKLSSWEKRDLAELVKIQKDGAKFKTNTRQPKWLDMARALSA